MEFIKNAGACVVSKNILNEQGKLKWAFREESQDPTDNGWRFFADIDDEAFVNDPSNLEVCDYNTVAGIEPAIIGIYLKPVGSDFQIVRIPETGEIKVFDNQTHDEIILD